ncbi:hypothetical protein D5P86_00860 [Salmonella enterica subsp. enterica serovar Infantis]|nr:hypothetical protein [Salmonella enterica subsp. enterica serovar Infantis]
MAGNVKTRSAAGAGLKTPNAEKKAVTAPAAYSGAASSAQPVASVSSLASSVLMRSNSLDTVGNDLIRVLSRLGLVELEPCGLASDCEQSENVLTVINNDLRSTITSIRRQLFDAVHGRDCDEDKCCDEDEVSKLPEGSIFRTAYGRTVFSDTQEAITALLNIQDLANRLRQSLMGVQTPQDQRGAHEADSVYSCICNLNEHIDDTVRVLQDTAADFNNNLLGM